MTEEEIFAAVHRNLLEVLPELEGTDITPDHSMRQLGANSIDRMDVVIATQDDLGIKVPTKALTKVDDLRSLVSVLAEYV